MTPTTRAWLMAYGDDPSTDWCTVGPKEPQPDDDGTTIALFDQSAIDSALAAVRERLRALVEAVRDANAESYPDADAFLLPTPGQSRAWLALLAGFEAP